MVIKFPFEKRPSPYFKTIYRPVALAEFYSKNLDLWVSAWCIVDTGADYTLLPAGYADKLSINLKKDCDFIKTLGVGGEGKGYLYRGGKIRIGDWEAVAPIGFLETEDVPPLLGRQSLLETLEVTFKDHETIFKLP